MRIALQELLRKAELDSDMDFLREGVRVMAQLAQHVGADKYERVAERVSRDGRLGVDRLMPAQLGAQSRRNAHADRENP